MQNKRCAIDGETDREGRGAGGAVTVSRSRTVCRALLPWAAAAALLFGGGELAAQQTPPKRSPEDKCTVSGTTVTCTGDLSPGVVVDDGKTNVDEATGTYTKLIVRDLTTDITPAAVARGKGISFDSRGDVDIDVDTGDFKIITPGSCDDCVGIAAYSQTDGAVTVRVKGMIDTSGRSSEGIDAGSGGDTGGAVTVEMEGNITTAGYDSNGISADSESKLVTVDVTGDITVSGESSKGIEAGSNGGDISITLHGGAITSVQGVGIEFADGADNTLTIRGPVTISGAGDTGTDIFADVMGGSGDETIDNYGTLTTPGRIDLGAGASAFNNHTGATFNSGTSVVLGDGNTLSNAGDLSPGGANAVQETTLTGNFQNYITNEQNIEEKGTFTVTIDNTGSDRLTVTRTGTDTNTGNAELGGTVTVRGAFSDRGPYTILSATSISDLDPGDDIDATRFDGVIDTLFIDYGLNYDTANTVKLTSARMDGVTFSEFAGTANQRAVANALDGLTIANAAVGDVMAVTTPEGARAAYDARSGEVHASLKGALMDAGQGTVAAVKSRMTARSGSVGAPASTAAFGTSSLADGQSGLWVTGAGASGETDATSGTARMETDRRGVVFGIDRALGEGWRLGVLGGYSRTDVTQRARLSSGSVDTWSVGLYGGAEAGAARFSFGAIYDGHAVDAHRSVPSIGLPRIQHLSAGYDARSWQLFAEAGHEVQAGGLMLEPFAGMSAIYLDTDGFSESGGAAALAASSDTDSMMFATLGLRGAMEVDDMIHLRGMAGWRHAFGDADPSSTHTLSGSPAFTVTGAPISEDALDIELGIEVGLSDTAVLGLAYKGRYGDADAAHGFNAGLKVTF